MKTLAKKQKKTRKVTQRESARALRCFEIYRDLGPGRDYEKLMVTLRDIDPSSVPNYGTLRNWACLFRWNDRLKDWDIEQRIEAERRAREERQQELMENLRKFRAISDRAVVNSMVSNAESLESIRRLVKQVLQRIELESVTNLRDLLMVADTLEKLTRNTDKAFDIKVKIEGLNSLLEELGDD